MHRFSVVTLPLLLALCVLSLAGAGHAVQGAPAAGMRNAQTAILGAQSRAAFASLRLGERRLLRVENPEALARHGLTGLSAGDEIEVRRLEDGRLRLSDPQRGNSVVLESEDALFDAEQEQAQ